MADEVARRLVHACGAVVPLAYLANLVTWPQIRLLLVVGIAAVVVLEAIRLVVGLEWWVYDRLTREYEQDNPAGYALYVFSGSLTGLVFDPQIAVPAMLMLTLADPLAGLCSSGELRTVKRPHVLGVMFAVSTALAVPFVSLPAAVAGGVDATLADGVKPVVAGFVLDDNFTIPLGAALAMAGTRAALASMAVPV
jgi:dolichol kinase